LRSATEACVERTDTARERRIAEEVGRGKGSRSCDCRVLLTALVPRREIKRVLLLIKVGANVYVSLNPTLGVKGAKLV
jgi:hypothetical protein